VFVWIFHRISGVLLIFLMVFQLATGFFQASFTDPALTKTMAELHKDRAVNCVLVFLFVFHGLYGVRTILIDAGLRREKLLFWVCTMLGLVLFLAFLVSYLTLVRP